MSEPENFEELHLWLERLSLLSDSQLQLPSEAEAQFDTPQSVWLWLFQYEKPFVSEIETAIEQLAIHEEGAFQDLTQDAAGFLRLRIGQATAMIAEFLTTEETPFAYPDTSFRELLHWLLVDWWKQFGIHHAATRLFLSRGPMGSEES